MPLSPPAEREHIHTRRYDFRGYRRKDGLWDIEGQLTDSKTYTFPNEWRGEVKAGEPVHEMRVRLTLDDSLTVREVELETAAGPYRVCPAVLPRFAALKELRIGPGWRRQLRELFGGVNGCTHHVEMLGALATVAFQTIWPLRARGASEDAERRPALIDSCHALASDGEVVRRFWPRFYKGS